MVNKKEYGNVIKMQHIVKIVMKFYRYIPFNDFLCMPLGRWQRSIYTSGTWGFRSFEISAYELI